MSFKIVEQATPRLNRSELSVPGSRPELFEKAAAGAADVIFLDLEDAVAPDDKEQARKNVIAALAYFAEPMDIIPDNVPVLGYIDDAIMIELVLTELKHELESFEDFCLYRSDEKARNRNPNLTREQYIVIKRRALHARMRRRRASAAARSSGGRRTRIRLF
ncbi:MAG: DUF1232 domain-containing protein [Proteobacteria bacterium]|nr:DUF1232 domain-containing protein [Pseudomonadota bacterium]